METTAKDELDAAFSELGPATESVGPATEMAAGMAPYFLDSGHGKRRAVASQLVNTIVGAAQTDGSFGVVLIEGPADPAPLGAHYHLVEHHIFYVLQGRLRAWVGDKHRLLYPGDSAFIPAKSPHSFQMEGSYTKFLSVNVPGGFETYFDVIGAPTDLFTAPSEVSLPTEEQIKRGAAEQDVYPVPDYDFGI